MEIILSLILLVLIGIGIILFNIEKKLVEWHHQWSNTPAPASEFTAKKTAAATQEVAHLLAAEQSERRGPAS